MAPPRPPLPLGQIFLVGAIVPAAFTAMDHWLCSGLRSGSVSVALILVLHIVQVGVLGVLCAHLIPLASLRWIIYGWGWLLFDTQTLLAVILSQNTPQAQLSETLASSLFAVQIGLLTVWAVLGNRPHWGVRWPVAIALSAILAVPFLEDSERYATQTVALLLICSGLAWQRFRMFRAAGESSRAGHAAGDEGLRVQFGVRHVLIWTTTIAILLATLRALDLLSLESLEFFRRHLGRDWIWVATEGGVVAIVLIISLWAGLGEGPAWLRWPLPFVLGVSAGLLLGLAHFVSQSPYMRIPAGLYSPSAWHRYWSLEDMRITWLSFTGGLLFAGLLYFRAQGVRLARMRKRPHQPDVVRPS